MAARSTGLERDARRIGEERVIGGRRDAAAGSPSEDGPEDGTDRCYSEAGSSVGRFPRTRRPMPRPGFAAQLGSGLLPCRTGWFSRCPRSPAGPDRACRTGCDASVLQVCRPDSSPRPVPAPLRVWTSEFRCSRCRSYACLAVFRPAGRTSLRGSADFFRNSYSPSGFVIYSG